MSLFLVSVKHIIDFHTLTLLPQLTGSMERDDKRVEEKGRDDDHHNILKISTFHEHSHIL